MKIIDYKVVDDNVFVIIKYKKSAWVNLIKIINRKWKFKDYIIHVEGVERRKDLYHDSDYQWIRVPMIGMNIPEEDDFIVVHGKLIS